MKNMINWFEIPASDFERACTFYSAILGCEFEKMNMMGMDMAFFPADEGKVSGGIVANSPFHTPSASGPVIYLNGNPDLDEALGKVEAAGGQVVMPKTQISPEIGYMAFFMDSEGNRIALHSNG